MKMIVLMSLEENKDQIRNVFKERGVHIYSEVDMTGHTSEVIDQYGWWHIEEDMPIYSKLYFAIIPKEKADQIMNDIKIISKDFHPQHPPRAFQVDVEKMI